MAKIFISYRRQDAKYPANRLYNTLKNFVSNPNEDIFIDIDSIPAGVDFVEHLTGRVAECEVLLVLVGEDWLDAKDPITGKRRIDNPDDFVRIEIAAALKRSIPVVPVLLDGVSMPYADQLPDDLKPLVRRNGVPVHLISFEADVARLVERLPVDISGSTTVSSKLDPKKASWNAGKRSFWIAGLLALIGLGAGATAVLYPFEALQSAGANITATTVRLSDEPRPTTDNSGGSALLDALKSPELSKLAEIKFESQTITQAQRSSVIRELQSALKVLGYYSGEVDGYESKETQTAVDDFSKNAGIAALQMESSSLSAVKDFWLVASAAAKEKSDAGVVTLNEADRASILRDIQTGLKTNGYFDAAIDGTASASTQLAADAFATKSNIKAPNLSTASRVDLRKFADATKKGVVGAVEKAAASDSSALPSPVVRELQLALQALGYYDSAIDGLAGPGTQRAAMAFAKAESIQAPSFETATAKTLRTFTDKAVDAAKDDEIALQYPSDKFGSDFSDRIYFEQEKWALSSKSKRDLRFAAAWLKAHPKSKIQISGHASTYFDSTESDTTDMFVGIALGQNRAVAVSNYLEEQGISSDRMDLVAFGTARPIAEEDGSPEASALNRHAWMQVISSGVD